MEKYEKPSMELYEFETSEFVVTLGISGEGNEGSGFDDWINEGGNIE